MDSEAVNTVEIDEHEIEVMAKKKGITIMSDSTRLDTIK